jgi:hypothetical protein
MSLTRLRLLLVFRQVRRGIALHLAGVIGFEGARCAHGAVGPAVVHCAYPVGDAQGLACSQVSIAAHTIGIGYAVPQGAVAIGPLGDALQGVAVGHLVAAGAGGGVVAVDGLVAKVEVGAVSCLAGDSTGNHAVAAGADGGEVGVAAIAPGVDLVDADAVAAQYFAVGDELALDGALLVDVQGAPGDVVDQAAVVAGLGVVADGCQVAVGVVAAFVPDGVFGGVVALPDTLPL